MPELLALTGQNYVEAACRGVLDDAIRQTGTDYSAITMITEDSTESVRLSYANTIFPLNAFKGEVQRIGVGIAEKTLTAAQYSGGIYIPKRAVQFDQTGQLDLAKFAAGTASTMPGVIEAVQSELAYAVWYAVANGHTHDDWLDDVAAGTYTFDDGHSWAPIGTYTTAQDNMGSTAFAEAELGLAIARMRRFKGPFGKPLGMKPTHLLVPPELEIAARKLIASVTNGEQKTFNAIPPMEVVAVSEFTETDWWMVCDASKQSMKPVILHIPNTLDNGLPNPRVVLSESADNDSYRMDIHLEYAVCLGPWPFWYAETV